jgi:hypothetical protein
MLASPTYSAYETCTATMVKEGKKRADTHLGQSQNSTTRDQKKERFPV